MLTDLAIMLGSFFAVTLIASLAGAANLGTAAGIGVLAFTAALVYVLTRR